MLAKTHVDEMQLRLTMLARAAPGAVPSVIMQGCVPNMARQESDAQAKARFLTAEWPLVDVILVPFGVVPLINRGEVANCRWSVMTYAGPPCDHVSHSVIAELPKMLLTPHITINSKSWWVNAKSQFWWMMVVQDSTLQIYKICGQVTRHNERTTAALGFQLTIPQVRVDWTLPDGYSHAAEKWTQWHWTGVTLSLITK